MALPVEAIQRSLAILLRSFQAAASRRHSMTMHAAASQTRETVMHSAASVAMYRQRSVEGQQRQARARATAAAMNGQRPVERQ